MNIFIIDFDLFLTFNTFNQQLPEGDVAVLKAFQSQHQRPMQIRFVFSKMYIKSDLILIVNY